MLRTVVVLGLVGVGHSFLGTPAIALRRGLPMNTASRQRQGVDISMTASEGDSPQSLLSLPFVERVCAWR